MTFDTLLAKSRAGILVAALFALGGMALANTRPVISLALIVVATLLAAGAVWSRTSAAGLAQAPGKLVSVDSTRLHILAEGRTNGSYPVIWVSGGHGEGLLMHHLHQCIKTETRSILFDRPGSGWSEIGRLPLTVSGEVTQLKLLLEASGESGPFVLAGHSFGGMFSANFAHHFPELVAGLVLLDPTPPWNVAFAGKLSFGATLRRSRWRALASQFGLGKFVEPEIDEHDSDYYRALASHADLINAHSVQPKSLLAEASIFRSVIANPFDLVIGSGALGELPLVLITANEGENAHAATRSSIKEEYGLTDLQVENLWAGLDDSNSQQARLSSRGKLLMAPEGASHMFPYEHPEFVLTEVRKMLKQIDAE